MNSSRRRIALEDFFRNPERFNPKLSPSGTHLAFLAPYERRLNVWVHDLETGNEIRVTDASQRDIADYLWANDDRLIYVQDRGGDENYRLNAVGRDGSDPLDLTPYDGVKCSIVDELEEIDNEILFQMNRRSPKVFDAYRLDVRTGTTTLVAENPGNVQKWFTDHAGRLRLAQTTDGVNSGILYRETEDAPWRLVASYDFKESANPLFFTFDDRAIFVASNMGRDRRAIFEYDLETGREGRLIFEHEKVDVSSLLASERRRTITGVLYVTSRPTCQFFDAHEARIQRFLDDQLPGRYNRIVSHSRNETRYVVRSRSDRSLGHYYLLESPQGGPLSLRKLFDASPWLDEREMAEVEPISYRARDGLEIHGYLTRPVAAAGSKVPMIILPHGGSLVARFLGFRAGDPIPRESRLCRAASQFPRLDRLRAQVLRGGVRTVGPRNAGRSHRRGGLGCRARRRRSVPRRDLRWELRRIRRPHGVDSNARSLCLRRQLLWPFEPLHLYGGDPTLHDALSRNAIRDGGTSRTRRGTVPGDLSVVPRRSNPRAAPRGARRE